MVAAINQRSSIVKTCPQTFLFTGQAVGLHCLTRILHPRCVRRSRSRTSRWSKSLLIINRCLQITSRKKNKTSTKKETRLNERFFFIYILWYIISIMSHHFSTLPHLPQWRDTDIYYYKINRKPRSQLLGVWNKVQSQDVFWEYRVTWLISVFSLLAVLIN